MAGTVPEFAGVVDCGVFLRGGIYLWELAFLFHSFFGEDLGDLSGVM